MPRIVHIRDIEIKLPSSPHDDLPADTQMSAQLIVDEHIFLQTVAGNMGPSRDCWKLRPDCEIPEWAPTFWLAIIRHSKTRGTRLIGYTEVTKEEVLCSEKNEISLCLNLVPVNCDGPSLQLTGNISVSEVPAMTPYHVDVPCMRTQINSVNSNLQTIEARLIQMNTACNRNIHPDAATLGAMYERILFLPSINKQRGRLLNRLGDVCLKHWKIAHRLDCLMQSVYAYEDAVRDDPGKLKYLQDLVSALYQRFNQCGSVSDINKAGLLLKDALCLAAHDDPHRSTIVEDLGTVLAARFHHLSDLGDINEYVSILEAAVHLTPDDHPTKYSMLNNLGGVLQGRFRRLGDLKDLDQSIFALEEAVHLTPDDHPDKPLMLTNLASSLDARFGRRGDLRDINQAISKQEDAFHMIPDGHPEWSGLLANLGTFRLHRFEQTGSLSGVHEGISKLKDAVSLTPDDHPEKPARLNNLGTFLGARFKRLGDLKDLHECISMLEEAVQLTPAGLPARFGHLTNLGTFLLCRFDQTGDLSDLNEGISKHKDAVSLIPDGHSERPNMLSNLAGSLSTRFTQVGDLNDLNECIAKMEEAVRLTPDGHPKKPDRLHNLGSTLQYRSERLGDLSDANDGIAMLQAAVQLMPEGHPDRHSKLNNLGQALQRRFHQLGDLRDINESISTLEEAICTTPDDHPDKPLRLTTLATSLVARFERLSDPRDINQSISNHEGAISLTPDGHPEVATRLANLGVSLLSRFQQFNDPNDIQESLCHFTAAACSATGQVNVRLKAAQLWANCAHKLQHTSLLEAFQVALNLLPEVAWLGLSISDRHHQIMRAGLLVGDAAWTAISAGKPERAVEWLEQGRSIIWGQLLSLRTPVDALRQEWPDLADELISLSGQLDEATTRKNDAPWVDSGDQQSLMSMADQAHKNAQKRSALVKKIQQLPGFQQFLLPKTISQLSSAAQKGPVVILNVSQTSCDGLILWKELSKEVIHVPLPKFTAENVKYLTQWLKDLVPSGGRGEVDRLYAAREEGYPDLEEEFAQILSELWVRLVKPILDALAITTPATDKLPRIWWCPTGPLTLLPIHAAGVYGDNVVFGSKLSDFVISSYTPSLAALMQGFSPMSQSQYGFQLLAVAQASSGGQTYIPGTRDEIGRIQQCARGKVAVCPLVDQQTTIANIEEGMKKSSWVHFACHGVQDRATPTESALLLAGDSRLTLERIIKLSLPHADFAFLSACQTATGDAGLQDESVHLAAGMLSAGYRGVIATMWSIMDNDAPQVAADVYEHLFRTSPPNSNQAAEALHLAVGNLRKCCGEKAFFRWVPFIHVGV